METLLNNDLKIVTDKKTYFKSFNKQTKYIPQLDSFKDKLCMVMRYQNKKSKETTYSRAKHHGAHFVTFDPNVPGSADYWYVLMFEDQNNEIILSNDKLKEWEQYDYCNMVIYRPSTFQYWTVKKNDFKEMCRKNKQREVTTNLYTFDKKNNRRIIKSKQTIIKLDFDLMQPEEVNKECITIKDFDLSKVMTWRPLSRKECTIKIGDKVIKYKEIHEAWEACADLLDGLSYSSFTRYAKSLKPINIKGTDCKIEFIDNNSCTTACEAEIADTRSEAEGGDATLYSEWYNQSNTELHNAISADASEIAMEQIENKLKNSIDLTNNEVEYIRDFLKNHSEIELCNELHCFRQDSILVYDFIDNILNK